MRAAGKARHHQLAMPCLAAGLVSLAAVLGGAFDPTSRAVVGSLLAVLSLAVLSRWHGPLAGDEAAALSLPLWGGISALLAWSMPLRAKETVVAWIVAWLLWVVGRRAGDTGRRASLTVLAAVGSVLALAVVVEVVACGRPRVGGLFENANVAAALIVPTLLAAVGRRRWLPRPLLWWVVGWLTVAALLSESRAGLLALLVGAVVMLPRGRMRVVTVLAGSLAAVALLMWRAAVTVEPLAWHRGAIWLALVRLAAAHPVAGVSPGGLPAASGQVRLEYPAMVGHHPYLITYAESSLLAVLVELGVVGLLLLGLVVVLWVRAGGLRRVRQDAALRGVLAAVLVFAAFHDLLEVEITLWWWALLIGLLERSEGGGQVTHPPRWNPHTAVVAVAVAGLVLWGIVQPAVAGVLWLEGQPGPELVSRVTRLEPWLAVPERWRVNQLLNEGHWSWREAAEALCRARRVTAVEGGLAVAWADLARVRLRIGGELGLSPAAVERARVAFARATELEPSLPWYWLEWAQLERSAGALERARSLAQRAIVAEPNCLRGWLLLARLELDLGHVDRARRALARAQEVTRLSVNRAQLSSYDRELLAAPHWQMHELENALR